MGAIITKDVGQENLESNVPGRNLFESLKKNANSVYTKNPTQTGTRPLEKINSRLDEAFSRRDEIEPQGVYKALFESSFPDNMVSSYSESDTQRRRDNVATIRDKSKDSVDKFMSSSDRTSMIEAKEEILRSVLEMRETIPVTRRIELEKMRGANSLSSSFTESPSVQSPVASSFKSKIIGKKSVSWADSVPGLEPVSPASSDGSLRSTGASFSR